MAVIGGGDGGANNNNNDGGGQGPVTSRCARCKRVLLPCPFCGHPERDTIAVKNEWVSVQEKRIAILETLERHYPWLLGSIAISILAPIIIPQFGLREPIPTIIGVLAGLVAFILGTYGFIKLKRTYESG